MTTALRLLSGLLPMAIGVLALVDPPSRLLPTSLAWWGWVALALLLIAIGGQRTCEVVRQAWEQRR